MTTNKIFVNVFLYKDVRKPLKRAFSSLSHHFTVPPHSLYYPDERNSSIIAMKKCNTKTARLATEGHMRNYISILIGVIVKQ